MIISSLLVQHTMSEEDDDYLRDDISNVNPKKRKLRVKNVYDSDSSNSDSSNSDSSDSDSEDSAVSDSQEDKNLEANKLKDEDEGSDSDMFASDNEAEEKEDVDTKNVKKRDPKKLDMEKLEKEFEIQTNNLGEEGPELESFDLRKEQEEGYFDKDGNFIRNKDSENEQETEIWTQLDKSEIEKAKLAKEKYQAAMVAKQIANSTEPLIELLAKIINHLEPDESPIEALRRLGQKKGRRRANRNKEEDKVRKQTVLELTDICDKLMIDKKLQDVYDMTREEFMRLYKSETGEDIKLNRGVKRQIENQDQEDTENYGEKVWEFRWMDLAEIQGPFSEYEMAYWKQNYFNDDVEVRRIGEDQFKHVSDVKFDDP